MRPFDDSRSMMPDERRAAIAKILAAGILRLHTRAALPSACRPVQKYRRRRIEGKREPHRRRRWSTDVGLVRGMHRKRGSASQN